MKAKVHVIWEIANVDFFDTPCIFSFSLRLYYNHGECIVLKTTNPEVDEIQEIVSRLLGVTQGCEVRSLYAIFSQRMWQLN
jgi:hypothetical protein